MRKTLSLVLYMALVEVVAVALVVGPVYAFTASQSTTGYVRTLNASGASAMFSASRPSQLAAVASAAGLSPLRYCTRLRSASSRTSLLPPRARKLSSSSSAVVQSPANAA